MTVELATRKVGRRLRRVDFVSCSCFVTQAVGESCRTIVEMMRPGTSPCLLSLANQTLEMWKRHVLFQTSDLRYR